jgi:hypothetical protein
MNVGLTGAVCIAGRAMKTGHGEERTRHLKLRS